MKLFERVSKFFGHVTVKESTNQVKITGIDGLVMRQYLRDIFETDLVTKMMFTKITDTSVTFHRFFVPDVIYMLDVLRSKPHCRWSVKRTVDRILDGLLKNTWYKISQQPVKSIIDPKRMDLLKWKALPKQLEFLHLYGENIPKYDLRGYILALAPGGGKTFSDLLVATCVIPPSVAEVKIIISPKKALHLVWEKSVNEVFKKTPTCWVSDSGIKMPLEKNEYYIFNYEQLNQAIELGKHLTARNIRFFTIVDESHNFSDYRSLRTQKLVNLQFINPANYFIWTSGSPILKNGAELISFLKCADPRFDNDAEQRFRRIYSASPGKANEIFNHRLGKMMAFVVGKSAFSPIKPTVVELPIRLPYSLSNKFLMSTVRAEMREFIEERLKFYQVQIKEYRRVVSRWLDYHETKLKTRADRKAFENYQKNLKILMRNPDLMFNSVMAETRAYERTKLFPSLPPGVRKDFRQALSAVKNIKLKVRGEALGTILSKRRSECAAVLALYCKPDQIMKESLSKTLFFASSVLPIKVLSKHLETMGFEPMLVYAGTNATLTSNIESFTNDPNINPICATMQSLSEAVPVTAASTVVLLNRPFRQATWDQVVARADRMGQIHPVTVIETTLDTGDEPNVSSTTDQILSSVRELINDIVGPEFAGPDPDEREYKELVNASQEDPAILLEYEKMGL